MERRDKTAVEQLRDDLVEMIESRKEVMASGQPNSYDEYKELCGVIHGLQLAVREIELLRKRYEED